MIPAFASVLMAAGDAGASSLFTFNGNPFAALTLIAAPAVLTNACSVLALGTSNRFARAVDRQREISRMMQAGTSPGVDEETAALQFRQLRRATRRAELVLRALTAFYVSLGSFAFAALVSLVGALGAGVHPRIPMIFGLLALAAGLSGVGGLVTGCSLLVRETRMTLFGLREEAAFVAKRFRQKHPNAEERHGTYVEHHAKQ